MARLVAAPLEAAAFAAFGEVTPRPQMAPGTAIAAVGWQAQVNLRPDRARPRLGWFVVSQSAWPVPIRVMERHRFSSQSFIPTDAATWLVVAAPHDPDGGPDISRLAAFLAQPDQAVTLRADVWHHPLTAFAPAGFAVQTFLADEAQDEEFRTLAMPCEVWPA